MWSMSRFQLSACTSLTTCCALWHIPPFDKEICPRCISSHLIPMLPGEWAAPSGCNADSKGEWSTHLPALLWCHNIYIKIHEKRLLLKQEEYYFFLWMAIGPRERKANAFKGQRQPKASVGYVTFSPVSLLDLLIHLYGYCSPDM